MVDAHGHDSDNNDSSDAFDRYKNLYGIVIVLFLFHF